MFTATSVGTPVETVLQTARAPAMSREDAEAFFAKLDKDGSGELSQADIKAGMEAIKPTTELPM